MLDKPVDKPPAHCSPKDLEIFTEEEIRKLRIFFINCTAHAWLRRCATVAYCSRAVQSCKSWDSTGVLKCGSVS